MLIRELSEDMYKKFFTFKIKSFCKNHMELLKKLLSNIFSSKKLIIGLSFFAGLILGYYLGLFNILHIMKNTLLQIHIDFSWIKKFCEISPSKSFLSDIAAFEATIIAFLVPLSIEIVSKLSERYKSDVINRTFEDSLENKILPYFLILNIVAVILLQFFINEDATNSPIYKICSWLILVGFIYAAFAILKVIRRIKKFMSNIQYVIDKLFNEIEKAFEE